MRPQLTPRQQEVARLISLGCTSEEMANILGLAVPTIENHRASTMAALGTDKAALVCRLAIKHRFSSLSDKLTTGEKRKSGRKGDGWN